MIVVRVEEYDPRTGRRTELARMRISRNLRGGAYTAESFMGRGTPALDRGDVQRRGEVDGWDATTSHVWSLVARMLESMGWIARASA